MQKLQSQLACVFLGFGLGLAWSRPVPSGVYLDPLPACPALEAGPTAVAVSLNHLTGSRLGPQDILHKHGYALLQALTEESRASGYTWKDAGDLGPDQEELLRTTVHHQSRPAILALKGADFSPSERGTVVVVSDFVGDRVTLYLCESGTFRDYSWSRQLLQAETFPDGNFVFVPRRLPSNEKSRLEGGPFLWLQTALRPS